MQFIRNDDDLYKGPFKIEQEHFNCISMERNSKGPTHARKSKHNLIFRSNGWNEPSEVVEKKMSKARIRFRIKSHFFSSWYLSVKMPLCCCCCCEHSSLIHHVYMALSAETETAAAAVSSIPLAIIHRRYFGVKGSRRRRWYLEAGRAEKADFGSARLKGDLVCCCEKNYCQSFGRKN